MPSAMAAAARRPTGMMPVRSNLPGSHGAAKQVVGPAATTRPPGPRLRRPETAAASISQPTLTASQRPRATLCIQANRMVPVSSSAASSEGSRTSRPGAGRQGRDDEEAYYVAADEQPAEMPGAAARGAGGGGAMEARRTAAADRDHDGDAASRAAARYSLTLAPPPGQPGHFSSPTVVGCELPAGVPTRALLAHVGDTISSRLTSVLSRPVEHGAFPRISSVVGWSGAGTVLHAP